MANEPSARSTPGADDGRYRSAGGGPESPLLARAPFLQNWDWQSVSHLNQRLCARGNAQHGTSSNTYEAAAADWDSIRVQVIPLGECLEFLRYCHQKAPFLSYNGNTFAEIARQMAAALFADLPPSRLKFVTSTIAHFVAGVLPRDSMQAQIDEAVSVLNFTPGVRVKTLRGTLKGVVTGILEDGSVTWRTDGTQLELITLPEALQVDE